MVYKLAVCFLLFRVIRVDLVGEGGILLQLILKQVQHLGGLLGSVPLPLNKIGYLIILLIRNVIDRSFCYNNQFRGLG